MPHSLKFEIMADEFWDDEDVCIIKRSIFDHPSKPYNGYFAEFIQEACGVEDPKEHVAYDIVPNGVSVLVRVPPFVVKDENQVLTPCNGMGQAFGMSASLPLQQGCAELMLHLIARLCG